MRLPKPECPNGYPHSQLEQILTDSQLASLYYWMRGQTQTICDGRYYSHKAKRYYNSKCHKHPHGVVMYSWDIERWMAGLPVID